jgi:spore coat polysaccharide biosynthesis protein SpsF
MGSSRLPGKVLIPFEGKPALLILLERLSIVHCDELVVATTTNVIDSTIAELCNANNINVFKGSEDNVLLRFSEAATEYNADIVIRICGDSPLIDGEIINELIDKFFTYKDCDYLSNTINQTYPLGMNAEIFKINALLTANKLSTSKLEREHVTPYIYNNPKKFIIRKVHYNEDFSNLRLTLDTYEDSLLINFILNMLYETNHFFTLKDIINLYKKNKLPFEINKNIKQKIWNQ